MSISPQSLARTRDKRSLRIPRKFEDFSLVTSGDIPTDISHSSAYKNCAEALKMKVKPNKRHTCGSVSDQVDQNSKKLATETNISTPIPPDNPTPSPVEDQNISNLSSKTTTTKSPSPPAQTSKSVAPEPAAAKRPPPKQRNATPPTPSSETIHAVQSTSPPAPIVQQIQPKVEIDDLDLECKESTPVNMDFRPHSEEADKPVVEEESNTKTAFLGVRTNSPENGDTIENLEDSTTAKSGYRINDPIFNKLEHLLMPSKSNRHSGPVTKPLVEKLPSSTPNSQTGGGATTPLSSKSAQRKKSKGFSLMLKTTAANGLPQQQANNISANFKNINNLNRPLAAHQPTKYYNNLPQSMQYGTRLMINEPILLPRSVASIAPITTTLQQIVNQARRPPFLSKKAEACIAYQETLKFDYKVSTHRALSKITEYLEVKDMLTLRLVNKTWKSVIDSDACWKKVRIRESRIVDWDMFARKLDGHGTTDLIFDQYTPRTSKENRTILNAFSRRVYGQYFHLRRILLTTVNDIQNKFAIEFICGSNYDNSEWGHDIDLSWHVKVMIDDLGIASVPLRCKNPRITDTRAGQILYCYSEFKHLLGDPDTTALVELSDLEDLFNGGKHDRSLVVSTHTRSSLRVEIKPI